MKFLDPKRELWKWGPIEGKLVYPDPWLDGMKIGVKKYPPGWPISFSYFYKDKMFFIADKKNLYDNGEKIFKKFILNENKFEKIYKNWLSSINNFNKKEKELFKIKLKILSDEELLNVFNSWFNFYSKEFWTIGLIPEVANLGGEKMLIEELGNKIRNENDFLLVFEKLSAPEDLSFYQKEELDLLSLKKIKKKRELEQRLKSHQKKYFWLLNSYHHAKVLKISYFKKKLFKFSLTEATDKINEIRGNKKNVICRKNKIDKKFNLSTKIKKISKMLSFCIWWQDFRKAYIFRAVHITSLFLKEISRRYRTPFKNLEYYNINEIKRLLETGKTISFTEMKKRKNRLLVVFHPMLGSLYYSGEKVRKLVDQFLAKQVVKNQREIKGLSVSQGNVRGVAQLVFSPKDFKKIKKGSILVTPMTAPDYVVAMKKSVGIITDEGGLTCHAAIVARELGLPCIVGTKIATKVLKDGDLVDVNADHGVITIIKKT